jgi:signal transduction histidine kinase
VPVDLDQVAREVSSDLEAHLSEVGGRIEVEALPTVEADPLQMRQLFQNLLGNALKFHRQDVPPSIRLRARRLNGSPERWRLEFEDNGIGFEEKYLDRIFKLFQRLHERGVYEGAGMGLAICRKIVERHGGTITAQSAPGVGSTFVVELPSAPPKPDPAVENRE